MYSLLLAIIYVAFISLGLPDSLLGSAWPIMQGELNVPISYAGIITMMIAAGTILSSLFSDRLTKKFGAGLVTAVSVATTALAMLGFSLSTAFWQLCLWTVPYGIGAGAIDAALNNYVALHYSSRHMSWLHSFWGLGTIISPYIMGACLAEPHGWVGGYRTVFLIQVALATVLFISLPLWKKRGTGEKEEVSEETKPLGFRKILGISGVPLVMVAFCCYCAAEQTALLWASSYFVEFRGIAEGTAARLAALFCIGITVGRFVCGFVSERLGDRRLIRIGIAVILVGAVLILLPASAYAVSLVGFILIGLGCAPIYPSIIHATPDNFGAENSQAVIGVEMASAYVGTTLFPPLFGLIAQHVSVGLLPVYIIVISLCMLLCSECLNRKVDKRKRKNS